MKKSRVPKTFAQYRIVLRMINITVVAINHENSWGTCRFPGGLDINCTFKWYCIRNKCMQIHMSHALDVLDACRGLLCCTGSTVLGEARHPPRLACWRAPQLALQAPKEALDVGLGRCGLQQPLGDVLLARQPGVSAAEVRVDATRGPIQELRGGTVGPAWGTEGSFTYICTHLCCNIQWAPQLLAPPNKKRRKKDAYNKQHW